MKSTITKRLVGVLAAGALSAGIGIGAAGPAQAAGSVWDRVAQCESTGNWNINTGNGYYGGLQFSSSTWRGFGGGKYASQANQATKGQQIAIAQRVLASQGPGAWPVCSQRAGLSKSNGNANSSASSSATKQSPRSYTKQSSRSNTKQSAPRTHSTPRHYNSSHGNSVTVKSGDTLGQIANRYNVSGGWRGLWQLNKSTVKNANWIYVGQSLRLG